MHTSTAQNRLLFLDRDGVINHDSGYVSKAEEFRFLPGIFELVAEFVNRGFLPVVVTNQSGIGRGYYTVEAFIQLTRWMQAQFSQHALPHIPVYYCPHHATAGQGEYKLECECRKPRPGMLYQAASDLHADLTQSVLIGDAWRDIEAGAAAGLPAQCLVSTEPAPQQRLGPSQVFQAASVEQVRPLVEAIIAASKSASDA